MRISAGTSRRTAVAVALALVTSVAAIAISHSGAATQVAKLYNCVKIADNTKRTAATATTTCAAGYVLVSWDVTEVNPTTTTLAGTTTTQPTTTTGATTTTQPAGAFLSYPHQSGPQSFSGSNIIISDRSYVGFGSPGITITNSNNVYIHDVDFDSMCGGIYLSHVTGNIRIENVRARNTGGCGIGSGHSNVIQLADSFASSGGIRNVNAYGGHTEDMLSIYKSGGVDASHVLVIENVHEESPLTGALAWSSGSGTCIDLADYGGHDIELRNSTFLNCGQVGIQMHQPGGNVTAVNNIVYGAARTASNVGLSQWSGTGCSPCVGGNAYITNRVWWVKSNGTASPWWLSGTYPVTIDAQSKTQDTTINPATLHVVL